jgi:glutaredoxin 3
MYSSAGCSYCWSAERLLARKGYTVEVVDVTFDRAARKWLAEQTGRRTLPQIKIGERWVGGFDDIARLDARGELDRLVAGAA